MSEESPAWSEENSRFFTEYAQYFVPDRDGQIHILCSLIPDPGEPFRILELGCGDGRLAGGLLERFPACSLTGLDGSHEMLRAARQHLAPFGDRFLPGKFDLAEQGWRQTQTPYQAIVSSLAIHHLDDPHKARLYQDLYALLQPGGVLLVADVIRPAGPLGQAYAAESYDEAVRRQSLELSGSLHAYEQFNRERWNLFRYPGDPGDQPSLLLDHLKWLELAGFHAVDVFWLRAGHAIFGGTR